MHFAPVLRESIIDNDITLRLKRDAQIEESVHIVNGIVQRAVSISLRLDRIEDPELTWIALVGSQPRQVDQIDRMHDDGVTLLVRLVMNRNVRLKGVAAVFGAAFERLATEGFKTPVFEPKSASYKLNCLKNVNNLYTNSISFIMFT